jgi:large subunit ribosomal protein L13
MNTAFPSKNSIQRSWFVLDADGMVLGRLASKAAMVLMGKHKPTYTPFIDTGDHIIVVNADKIRLTGRKEEQKVYRTHSGYPGGLKEVGARKMRQTRPARMIELAIQGMLPKNKLGKSMYRKLNVYAGDKHPHQAQKPVGMSMEQGEDN